MDLTTILDALLTGDVITKGILIYLVLQNEKANDEIREIKRKADYFDERLDDLQCPMTKKDKYLP